MKSDDKPIIVTTKRLTCKFLCPKCNSQVRLLITKIKEKCPKCGKLAELRLVEEDDFLRQHAWLILKECNFKDNVVLQAVENNMAGVERLVSLYSNLGLREDSREFVDAESQKTKQKIKVWRVYLEKDGALIK